MRHESENPDENPGGQRALTRKEYDRLTPSQQGFVTYMQGCWNPEVPNFNLYRQGSKQYREFTEGEQRAVFLSQDHRATWRRWAPLLGLCAQPFWFYATWKAGQWGIFALSFLYAFSWARGAYNFWLRPA